MAKNKEWREPDSEGIFIIDVTAAALAKEKNIEITGKNVEGKEIPASTDLDLGMIIPAEDTFVNETDNSRV